MELATTTDEVLMEEVRTYKVSWELPFFDRSISNRLDNEKEKVLGLKL